jgi:hypothetical protein
MDFDFPEPYDLEVPRRIGEARQELTPAGEEVLERLLAALANPGGAETPESIASAMAPLQPFEQRILHSLNDFLVDAHEALARELQGETDLYRQLARLVDRARELDPSLRDDVTMAEAVEVLRRHGEPLGISDEVLEMLIWVPREE